MICMSVLPNSFCLMRNVCLQLFVVMLWAHYNGMVYWKDGLGEKKHGLTICTHYKIEFVVDFFDSHSSNKGCLHAGES